MFTPINYILNFPLEDINTLEYFEKNKQYLPLLWYSPDNCSFAWQLPTIEEFFNSPIFCAAVNNCIEIISWEVTWTSLNNELASYPSERLPNLETYIRSVFEWEIMDCAWVLSCVSSWDINFTGNLDFTNATVTGIWTDINDVYWMLEEGNNILIELVDGKIKFTSTIAPSWQVSSDWNATSWVAQILNKPTLFSGSWNDLTDKPTIPAAQVNSDWDATSWVSMILNKPTLFSGNYSDLIGTPTSFTPSAHTHNASDITAGVLAIARIPTGTSASTVALGNHTHTFASLTSKPTTLSGYGITNAYTKTEVDWLIWSINHNDLENIQGGITWEYYHLTEAQHNLIEDIESNWLTVKPTNLSWTTTNWSIVVRNNDNTFRDATPEDIEAMWFGSGWTVQSSWFWEYELWENIPTGIHAVTLLNWEVNTNLPTLSATSLSPSWETINGVNYKVTYSFPTDVWIDNAWRIFNGNGWTITNWVGTYHTTLELSQPISFNHLKYSGNDLLTDVKVYTSVDWTTWTLISTAPSKRWWFHYIPTTTSRFIKVEFIRTSYNVPNLGWLWIWVVNTINNKVYIAKTSHPDYRIINWYVLWPKSAWEIVKISNLENTTITWNWVDWKNQFVKDDGTIWDTGNIFIWWAYNWKLVVWKWCQPYPSKTYSMIFKERFRWKARPFMKIYSHYHSSLWGSLAWFTIYNAKDMSVIYTFSAQNTYSGVAADASAVVFQSMTDMDIIIECTSMNTNEIWAINLTITQI